MKPRFKLLYKIAAFLAFLVVLCMILTIPAVAEKVSNVTGIAADKLKRVGQVIMGSALGLMLVSFGVTALAAVPIVGVLLIVIGLTIAWWAVKPLLQPTMKVSGGQSYGLGQR